MSRILGLPESTSTYEGDSQQSAIVFRPIDLNIFECFSLAEIDLLKLSGSPACSSVSCATVKETLTFSSGMEAIGWVNTGKEFGWPQNDRERDTFSGSSK